MSTTAISRLRGPTVLVVHGVHPAVKGEQAAAADQVIDLVTRESRSRQLPPRHDPVLRALDRRCDLKWRTFCWL